MNYLLVLQAAQWKLTAADLQLRRDTESLHGVPSTTDKPVWHYDMSEDLKVRVDAGKQILV